MTKRRLETDLEELKEDVLADLPPMARCRAVLTARAEIATSIS